MRRDERREVGLADRTQLDAFTDQHGRSSLRLPSSAVMARRLRALVALCSLVAVAGCGGGDASPKDPVEQVPAAGGLQERVRAAQQVRESDFPSSAGKTLQQIAEEVKGGGSVEAGLATSVFTVGTGRL